MENESYDSLLEWLKETLGAEDINILPEDLEQIAISYAIAEKQIYLQNGGLIH